MHFADEHKHLFAPKGMCSMERNFLVMNISSNLNTQNSVYKVSNQQYFGATDETNSPPGEPSGTAGCDGLSESVENIFDIQTLSILLVKLACHSIGPRIAPEWILTAPTPLRRQD